MECDDSMEVRSATGAGDCVGGRGGKHRGMLRASVEVVNSWDIDAGLIVRLLGAALLGGVVGAEREASGQPAGLRTHIAVALGAALFGAISTLGFQEFDQARARTVLQADVTRVASNVAVGIGFLGAGVIFRQGDNVKNLTTAASLWVVAAIGLAAGVGNMSIAVIGTVTLVLSLVLLRPVRTFIRKRAPRRDGGPDEDD